MHLDPTLDEPTLDERAHASCALNEARRREKLSQAEWRRRRAEVARLVAAGEEAAARALLAEIGVEAPGDGVDTLATSPTSWQPQPVIHEKPAAAKASEPQAATRHTTTERSAILQVPKTRSQTLKKAEPKPAKASPTTGPKRPGSVPRGAGRTSDAPRRPVAKSTPRSLGQAKRRRSERRRSTTWAEWVQMRPPWATSLATHGVLLTLFGLLSFATFGEPGFSLSVSLADEAAWDDMPAEVTLTDLEVESEQDLAEPIDASFDLAADVELASLVEPVEMAAVTAVGDVMAISAESLMAAVPAASEGADGDGEAAEAGGGKPAGAAGKVSFFGAEANAERVIFVVDNSGSMQQGRMETTLAELNDAVRRLSESQEFYVVFFSDQAYPMFFPEPAAEPLRATQDNKRQLTAWLHRVEMCVGGRVLDAMELAASLEPDVVYLLTDGDIRSAYVAERLTTPQAWPFLIHTLGMGARTPEHLALLQAIAANTGGEFRPVGPNRVAIARARNRLIPYHRTPGPVWGSAIKPWN